MAAKSVQYGPVFVRNQCIALDSISSDGLATGWREVDDDRVQVLTTMFLQGAFGQSVTCGVQIMDKEDTDGRKLIDDGVSTVLALRRCHAAYQANKETTPEGDVWPQSLMSIFSSGLHVRVVAYEDDDDREVREAWNTAKHDEESNTIRWSTLFQKMNTAVARFKKLGDWSKVTSSLLEFYGPTKRTTVGRWVRAAKGMNPKVLEEIKQYPSLKGTYLWPYGHNEDVQMRNRVLI
jgi:hypothetical protein